MLRSKHLIETLENIVREKTPELETNERRENWNQNDLRLIEKRTLEYQVSKKN